MNSVNLVGRLAKEVEVKYTAGNNPIAVMRNTIAVRRDKDHTDFIPIKVFGKMAENCEKFVGKGNQIAVSGRIETGSYENKNGDKVYTIEVVVNSVEFISFKDNNLDVKPNVDPVPSAFSAIEEDIPF